MHKCTLYFSFQIESELSILTEDNEWKKVFAIPKMGLCRSLDNFVGPLWHDIQRLNGIAPRTCPLKGLFRLTNYKLDMKQVRMTAFPFGKLKIASIITYKATKGFQNCIDLWITTS